MTQLQERQWTAAERRSLAKSGAAMASGAYPVTDEATLSDAIHAVGRGGADHDAIRAHIMARAKALGLMKKIPDNWMASGALKEAQSLDERLQAVQSAIFSKMMPAPMMQPEMPSDCCEIKDVFDDYAIVEQGKKTFKVPYSLAADGTVTLKDPVEVEETYVPVKEGLTEVSITEAGSLLEAKDGTGRVWDALLIKAGTSGNRRHYPAAMLRRSVPLFEGSRAFADHPARGDRPERSIRDVVGWFDGVRWDDARQGIRGSFHVLESADWLRQGLKSAFDAGKSDLFGFSINADGRKAARPHTDGSTLIESITTVFSTDVVTVPGAGGYPLGILESQREDTELVVTADEIRTMFQEALAGAIPAIRESLAPPVAVEPLPADTNAQIDHLSKIAIQLTEAQQAGPRIEDLNDRLVALQEAERAAAARVALSEQKQLVRDKVDAAKFPRAHADRLRTKLLEAVEARRLEEAEIDAEVGFMRDLIRESGPAQVAWEGARAVAGDDFKDKFNLGVQGFFEGKDVEGVKRFTDLHRMSYAWNQNFGRIQNDPWSINAGTLMEAIGHSAMAGRHEAGEGYRVGLLESLTTASWGDVFADNLYKMTMKVYADDTKYNAWREVVSMLESPPSFQTRHVKRIGGYANMPQVAEQGTYTSAVSPTDEAASYALAKYGFLEDLTFEMLQDPTAAAEIASMPTRMARSAHRTLYTFVFNTILRGAAGVGMTATYDSVATFNAASHSNLITSAGLSVGKLQTARRAMRAQTAYGETAEVLGDLNEPRILLVPADLQGIADRLIGGTSGAYLAAIASSTDTDQALDPNLFRGRFRVIVVDIWTDTNDWILVSDPATTNTIVMGFLNGRQEPELFVQDNPTTGSVFSADKISYKIRSCFSGTMLDHRSFLLAQG